jgi:tetratricopeptide (TPR) repeat protein
MGLMNRLPKLEKKHLVASGALTAVALVAFFMGTASSGKKTDDAHASKPTVTAGHGEHVAVAKPAHDIDEGQGHSEKPADRVPAAAPAHDSSPSEENYEEEEVDIQIARHAPKFDKATGGHEVENDHVSESASAPIPKEDHRGFFKRITDAYVDAWESTNTKVQSIQRIEDENKKLKLENAYLRVMVETKRFAIRSEEAKKKTETVGKKLETAAGSRAARSIASIRYQFPENLQSDQLLALGVSYFKNRDDEKAAVILNFLTELDEDQSFRTASNYLMAGIAFYRLDHYKNASEYFDRVQKLSESDDVTEKAKRQASYWKALVAERMKNHGVAQKLILESLEKDPQAKEARWVNPQGIEHQTRMPASTHTAERETEESHEGHTPTHH